MLPITFCTDASPCYSVKLFSIFSLSHLPSNSPFVTIFFQLIRSHDLSTVMNQKQFLFDSTIMKWWTRTFFVKIPSSRDELEHFCVRLYLHEERGKTAGENCNWLSFWRWSHIWSEAVIYIHSVLAVDLRLHSREWHEVYEPETWHFGKRRACGWNKSWIHRIRTRHLNGNTTHKCMDRRAG